MLDTLWQAWKGFSLDTAELSFPVQQIPYRRYSIISVMFFNRMKLFFFLPAAAVGTSVTL